MDEKEQELQEFSLEDILKEFGDAPASEEPVSEDTLQMPDIVIDPPDSGPREPENPVPEEEASAEEEPVPPEAPQSRGEPSGVPDETIRLDDLAQVRKEDPESEEMPDLPPAEDQADDAKAEPFSDGWEPEYEQPMGEYVPPQPIIFRPRSRLRELKRKLIAGPEKRYYELSEVGVGRLQAAIFLSLLVVLLSGGATVMFALGLVQENRMRLMVFGQFLAMLLSALLGSFQFLEGISDLFHKKFSLNTLLVFTFIACCVDGILCLQQLRVPCCAAFSLEMTMSLWSTYHRRSTEMSQMDTMRKATRLDGLAAVPDYYEGRVGLLRSEGQVEDFMDHYSAPSGPEKVLSVYALIALLASVAIGVFAGVRDGLFAGAQVTAVSLLAAMPATIFITLSRPMAVLERRFHRLGTVLCGWQGIRGMRKKVAFPLSHSDLFPAGSAKMNGVKFYGSRDTDEVVAYATALITADGGGLAPLFTQLLDSRNGRHYDVENLQAYGNGGIGGEVNGEPVLVGVLSFLREMGVEVPEGTRVNQAVYVAVDGELCGLFAISYGKVKSSAAGIATLCSYRGVKPVLTTGDFMLTESFIRSKFLVNTRRIAFPERSVRMELGSREPAPDAQVTALTTQEGLAPLAYAVTGARSLRTAWIAGVAVHILGGILGLAMMLALAIVGAEELLTPSNMFLYELVWMIPGLLLTEWTRSI